MIEFTFTSLKVTKTPRGKFLFSILPNIYSFWFSNAVSVDMPDLKPYWEGVIAEWILEKYDNLVNKIFSITLEDIGNTDIGL